MDDAADRGKVGREGEATLPPKLESYRLDAATAAPQKLTKPVNQHEESEFARRLRRSSALVRKG